MTKKVYDKKTGRYLTQEEIAINKKNKKEGRREYSKRYCKEMRETAISIGNCSSCYKEKENSPFKMCLKCRLKTWKLR